MSILSYLAYSQSPVLNPDRNPLLRYLLKKTFYTQFCAGETQEEIKRTVRNIKELGYKGVILGYAKEVVMNSGEAKNVESKAIKCSAETNSEVEFWKKGTMETILLAEEGDFVALKYAATSDHLRAKR